MRKIVFLYPGQGSQKVGMGEDLIRNYPPANDIFREASRILGFDLKKLCLKGPEEELTRTKNLQPALLTVSWILTKLLEEKGILPLAVAGHSLGEYSAILAARVVDFSTALKIVTKRAELMEEAGKEKKGGMVAVIGLKEDEVLRICEQIGQVQAVNFNCPGQIVVSGIREKISSVIDEFKKSGAKKVIPLPVSGAFHSFLMKTAAEKFSLFLDQFNFGDPIYRVVSNATGEFSLSGEDVKNNLKLHMDHPVLWEKSMRVLIGKRYNTFIEVGPGKVLQGLVKRIEKKVEVFGVEGFQSVNALLGRLKKENC